MQTAQRGPQQPALGDVQSISERHHGSSILLECWLHTSAHEQSAYRMEACPRDNTHKQALQARALLQDALHRWAQQDLSPGSARHCQPGPEPLPLQPTRTAAAAAPAPRLHSWAPGSSAAATSLSPRHRRPPAAKRQCTPMSEADHKCVSGFGR